MTGTYPARGNEAVPELLAARGLTTVFSMLGGTNVPWIGAGVHRGRLRLVPTRHEATSVSAAVGYARSTGSIGLCSVSRGPGFANAVNALIAAVRNHSPIVLVVGESPAPDPTTAQNVDQRGMTGLIGAGFHHAGSVAAFAAALDDAVAAARWDGCPQVVSMADAVLDEPVSPGGLPEPAGPAARTGPDQRSVAEAADLLAGARAPLVLAGQGAVHAGSRDELVALAEATGARLATSLLANHFFAGHPRDLGLCGGWAPVATRAVFRQCDLVLVFGASFNQFTSGHGELFRGARVVHCDIDPAAIGEQVRVDLALAGDARETARRLLEEWRRRGLPSRPAPVPVDREAVRESVLAVPLRTSGGLDPRAAYRLLDEVLPANRLVVTDSGRSLPTLPSLVRTGTARDFLVGRGYGSVGLGLGTALGAACARPDAHVVLFTGDGGLMMMAQELDAVRLAGVPLTIVVMNDQRYGAEVKHLRRYGLPDTIAVQPPPDLVRLVEVFGGTGCVVETLADIERLTFTGSGLRLVDVRIDPEVEGTLALGSRGEAALREAGHVLV